ncbi:efflux RND transporter periplasmic adaptor subunit [Caballeronia sp. LZ065]|uniref:efflux RND transporter periplasmic adaptor subunit n=1 Tax=Caballeronia sp. LZ065 TaxID=3038571 RepID=UPI0028568172|nr:efflux RND transporter periplasmic adaptor subunit [Caballeronia sp. LZ065]MDR5783153.1 efflux RND transporter periplasmic adaptor subunit [Caballeronia sp. LZ065]
MKSRFRRATLSCLCPIVLAACSKSPAPPAPPRVATVTVQARSAPLERSLVGRLSPYYSANVTARVSGLLLKRDYTEGAPVRAGQLLFEIDPAFYRTQLDTALAVLAQDRAVSLNNRITAQRDRRLLPVGSVSQQTVDNADAAERSAAAKVQADEAAVQSARVALGYTRVTAPVSGIAGEQQVTAGAVVGNGTSDSGGNGTLLTTIQTIDPMYVNFTISSADLATLEQPSSPSASQPAIELTRPAETTVRIALPNGAPYGSAGTLDFSGVTVNAATGAVNLRARVANPDRRLLPGMYVTLTVDLGWQNGVFLIPQQALLRDTAGAYVLTVGANDVVARRDVEAAESRGSDWIVTRGLGDGDRVLVTGLQAAHEGRRSRPSRGKLPHRLRPA